MRRKKTYIKKMLLKVKQRIGTTHGLGSCLIWPLAKWTRATGLLHAALLPGLLLTLEPTCIKPIRALFGWLCLRTS